MKSTAMVSIRVGALAQPIGERTGADEAPGRAVRRDLARYYALLRRQRPLAEPQLEKIVAAVGPMVASGATAAMDAEAIHAVLRNVLPNTAVGELDSLRIVDALERAHRRGGFCPDALRAVGLLA